MSLGSWLIYCRQIWNSPPRCVFSIDSAWQMGWFDHDIAPGMPRVHHRSKKYILNTCVPCFIPSFLDTLLHSEGIASIFTNMPWSLEMQSTKIIYISELSCYMWANLQNNFVSNSFSQEHFTILNLFLHTTLKGVKASLYFFLSISWWVWTCLHGLFYWSQSTWQICILNLFKTLTIWPPGLPRYLRKPL